MSLNKIKRVTHTLEITAVVKEVKLIVCWGLLGTLNRMSMVCTFHHLGCSQRKKWRISSVILFACLTFSLQNGRTGKNSLTLASLYPLYFVTLWIMQAYIDPPFPTTRIFLDWGACPPWLRPLSVAFQKDPQLNKKTACDDTLRAYQSRLQLSYSSYSRNPNVVSGLHCARSTTRVVQLNTDDRDHGHKPLK